MSSSIRKNAGLGLLACTFWVCKSCYKGVGVCSPCIVVRLEYSLLLSSRRGKACSGAELKPSRWRKEGAHLQRLVLERKPLMLLSSFLNDAQVVYVLFVGAGESNLGRSSQAGC
ncbi:unnamed protein product [Ostreobium quekettii]|uniref:Secreted protein n=1 Tax=Ostreobium quekettii TaxID=121088 RepID=A0A8S1JCL7_9CHLO|nr:unnamed protein product [Ostreobium quekettii]